MTLKNQNTSFQKTYNKIVHFFFLISHTFSQKVVDKK